MARRQNNVSPEVAQRLVDLAREMRQLVYGESGVPKWGTKFSQIESDGMAVGHELARLIMEQSVADQAGQVPAEAFDTGGEVAGPAGTEEMLLETPAGEVEWKHPRGFLKESRRAFFPSGPRVGRGRG